MAAMGASDTVGKEVVAMVYVRARMEGPQWVTEVLSSEKTSKRQPGQGTRWK